MKKPAEIAVFLGDNGNTTKFYGEGRIVIFVQENNSWRVSREKRFSLKEIQEMMDFRQKMEETLVFLDQCKVFVGSSITGMPYYFLEKAKCSVWECDGIPYDFLDYVQLQEEISAEKTCKKGQQQEKSSVDSSFIETTPGNYSISIKGIQEKSVQLTSKQVLLPFLRRGSFESLEIICNHMPIWLEEEVLRRRISLQTKELSRNQVKITLKK